MPNDYAPRPGEISRREASERSPYAESALTVLAETGKIPGAVFRGGRWYFPRTCLALIGGRMQWADLGAADVRP